MELKNKNIAIICSLFSFVFLCFFVLMFYIDREFEHLEEVIIKSSSDIKISLDSKEHFEKNIAQNIEILKQNKRTYKNKIEKENNTVELIYHAGGIPVDTSEFNKTVKIVLDNLDFVPSSQYIIELLYETSCIESHRGFYVKQIRGKALGVYQFELKTVKCLIDWLKSYHKEKYTQIMAFYDDEMSLKENIMYNFSFQSALSIAHFYRYVGDSLADLCSSPYMRCVIYKKYHNTPKGKSTYIGYFEKLEQYG